MPRLTDRLPAYRLHKHSGQAIVSLSGKIHYLGRFGSPESKQEYRRLTGEWLTRGQSQPPKPTEPGKPETTINELVLAFWTHARTHYRSPDGQPTQEQENVFTALQPLQELYGRTLARDFGPLALRALRDHLVRSGRLARGTINSRIGRIRRAFKWAASVEMIPATVHEALMTVDGLRLGRSDAPEAAPVESVPREVVEATLPYLPRPVAAMVQIQLLTGCRAGEVVSMRACDVTFGETPEFRPSRHKNTWRGRSRRVPLGHRAIAIIQEFLTVDMTAYLFTPAASVMEVRERRRTARKSKPTPSEQKRRSQRKPTEVLAPRYDRRSYRQCVVRACDRAFPHPVEAELLAAIAAAPKGQRHKARAELVQWKQEHRAELKAWRDDHRWSPLQLRHTVATEIETTRGREAASAFLGHAKLDTTGIYVDRDLSRARAIAAEIG
jgi:integrase